MKQILITGANRGIGLATVKALAEAGHRVFLASRERVKGEAARAALPAALQDKVTVVELDTGDEASIARAVSAVSAETPRLDALINNAGIYEDGSASALEIAPQVVEETFRINTLGPLLVTRAFLPLLEKAGVAEVVNLSSTMGQLSDMGEGSLAYRISKTALNAVTRILGNELEGRGIRVNSMHPGWVKTDMGGAGAQKSVEEGADTAVWLALGGAKGAQGGFYSERKAIPW